MSNETSRFPSWQQIKSVVEFKTFYIALLTALLGVMAMLIEPQLSLPPASPFKGVLTAIGITLLTSSTVSIFTEMAIRFDVVDLVSNRISASLAALPLRGSEVDHPDLLGYKQARDEIDFVSLVRDAQGFLGIHGLSANDVLAAQPLHALRKRLRQESNFQVRILLLNPWSLTALLRASQNAYAQRESFFEKLVITINQVLDFQELPDVERRHPGVELRVYDGIPTVSTVFDARQMLLTPLNCVRTGGASPSFLLRPTDSSACAYRVFVEHFEASWDTAQPIRRETLAALVEKSKAEGDAFVAALRSAEFTGRLAARSTRIPQL